VEALTNANGVGGGFGSSDGGGGTALYAGAGLYGGDGGTGGYGAGGGGGGFIGGSGGNGGFGGGGGLGGGGTSYRGSGGFGAGNGGSGYFSPGGGGLGAGGAIFVASGGTLAFGAGTGTLSGNAATGGAGGTAYGSFPSSGVGQGLGGDLFVAATQTISLNPGAGNTLSFADSIDDETGSGGTVSLASAADDYSGGTSIATGSTLELLATGAQGTGAITGAGAVAISGPVDLSSAADIYSGGTTILSGTLEVATLGAAGTGAITFGSGAKTLQIATAPLGTGIFTTTLDGFTTGDTIDLAGIGTASLVTLGAGNALSVFGSEQIMLQLDPSESFSGASFLAQSDGAGGTDITLIPLPVVTTDAGTATFTGGGSAVALDSGLTVTDATNPTLDSATVSISGGFLAGASAIDEPFALASEVVVDIVQRMPQPV
jgi:hypothetical protein